MNYVYENNNMRTIIKTTAFLMLISLSSYTQVKNNFTSGGPKPGVFVPHLPSSNQQVQLQSQTNASGANQWVVNHGNYGNGNDWYGNMSLAFGNSYYPNYGPGYGYYGNSHSLKHSVKMNIREAGYVINDAVSFNTWHDIYSPLLAKAIRHYHYARQLYGWRNYSAALNHSERAKYLAWYSLQYFQNPGYYYDGYNGNVYNQPHSYSDLYYPYYKNGTKKNDTFENQKGDILKSDAIDEGLPTSEINDKEVIRSFNKSTISDE